MLKANTLAFSLLLIQMVDSMLNDIYLEYPFKILLNIKILYNLLINFRSCITLKSHLLKIEFKLSNRLLALSKRLLTLKPTLYKGLNFKIHFKML
jgi:hypothetical protein